MQFLKNDVITLFLKLMLNKEKSSQLIHSQPSHMLSSTDTCMMHKQCDLCKKAIFVMRLSSFLVEPASTKENNCLNAAKACNLNDTCKKYRSAYINPCTSRVSASEVCNKRKCHKALRQFFDKVTKHVTLESYLQHFLHL